MINYGYMGRFSNPPQPTLRHSDSERSEREFQGVIIKIFWFVV